MNFFVDTSSLVKLYHTEQGSERASTILSHEEIEGIYISRLSSIEFSSAIYKKVRSKAIDQKTADGLIAHFKSDAEKYTWLSIPEIAFD